MLSLYFIDYGLCISKVPFLFQFSSMEKLNLIGPYVIFSFAYHLIKWKVASFTLFAFVFDDMNLTQTRTDTILLGFD